MFVFNLYEYTIVKKLKLLSFSKLMDIEINISKNTDANNTIDNIEWQKMIFIYNALDNGWTIKKLNKSYIFSKKHEGKKEFFDENYLAIFIKDNINKNNILS